MFDDHALLFMPGGDETAPPDGEEVPPPGGGSGGQQGGNPPPSQEANTDTSTASLLARIRDLEAQIASAQEAMQSADRAHLIEAALLKAGAIDIETASLLIERLLEDSEVDDLEETIDQLVREVRLDKPFLFAQEPAPASAALAAVGLEDNSLHQAAQLAASQGDRSSLLRYLRLRRGTLN